MVKEVSAMAKGLAAEAEDQEALLAHTRMMVDGKHCPVPECVCVCAFCVRRACGGALCRANCCGSVPVCVSVAAEHHEMTVLREAKRVAIAEAGVALATSDGHKEVIRKYEEDRQHEEAVPGQHTWPCVYAPVTPSLSVTWLCMLLCCCLFVCGPAPVVCPWYVCHRGSPARACMSPCVTKIRLHPRIDA